MAKMTVGFGLVLIVLGVAVFIGTGSHAPTALIPAFFGVALGILGLLADTENAKKRMTVMHIAVTIGLLGFLFPGVRAGMAVVRASGGALLRPVAVEEEAAMAAIMLVYVLLCVRSFIAARKARTSVG